MKSIFLKTAVTAVLMGMTAVAFGAPPPGKGGGGGSGGGPPDGKGNKPDTEVGFSLSVPAIIVGTGSGFAISCYEDWAATGLDHVEGTPLPYPGGCQDPATVPGDDEPYCVEAGDYFVQRIHTWQAGCLTAERASADAEWGDNLGGDASLKVGSPIRVELVLLDSTTDSAGQEGYQVIKLEPNELDRNSDYGHLALEGGLDNPIAVDGEQFRAIVHDADASLTIELLDDGGYLASTVYDGEAGAEINATGKIVYGHNLRVVEAGTYRLTYTLPNVDVTGVDIGDFANNEGVATVTLEVDVLPGGGGGGGKK
jgi:hypothetical protein